VGDSSGAAVRIRSVTHIRNLVKNPRKMRTRPRQRTARRSTARRKPRATGYRYAPGPGSIGEGRAMHGVLPDAMNYDLEDDDAHDQD
jgi:hypothetical protein